MTSFTDDTLNLKTESQKSLTLDEIFGFNEAKKRAEAKKNGGFENDQDSANNTNVISNRVFINHVDSYHGKAIVTLLSKQEFVTVKSEEDDEDEDEGAAGDAEAADSDEEQKSGSSDIDDEQKVSKTKKEVVSAPPEKLFYDIIGTVKDPATTYVDGITNIISADSKSDEFKSAIIRSAYVIYDISLERDEIPEADAALDIIIRQIENEAKMEKPPQNQLRTFVLVSTVMTWSLTKPIDPDEPETPFTDVDYRKRRAHPNYKSHIILEKEVLLQGKKYKGKLRPLVITSAVTYGGEEHDLHVLFKMAWFNKDLPIWNVRQGKNMVPLIHVNELAQIVTALVKKITTLPSKTRYVLAVGQNACKLKQIVKALAKVMGTGKTNMVDKEEAFLEPEVTQQTYERCTMNLLMEPEFVLGELGEDVQLRDSSFVEDARALCNEWRDTRRLLPVRAVVLGPPASGKSRVSRRLAEHYGLHYVSVPVVIQENLDRLRTVVENHYKAISDAAENQEGEAVKGEDEEEDEDDDDDEEEKDDEDNIDSWKEELAVLEHAITNNERLEDDVIVKMVKERLMRNDCRNQGYVLDGFPKTQEQANALFTVDEDDEELDGESAEEETEGKKVNKQIEPELVVGLEATDDFLCQRVMRLPESEVQNTHYTEEHMLRRLNKFRELNTEEESVYYIFDELEIYPVMVPVMDEYDEPEMDNVFQVLVKRLGAPRNFGPSKEQLEEEARQRAEEQMQKELEEKQKKEEEDRIMKEQREKQMEEWAESMAALRSQEEEVLAAQGDPLRHYLMRYVFPTLTRGLIATAQLRPADPLDYLAEYLFKENPEGKMFNPAYCEAAEFFDEIMSNLVETSIAMGSAREKQRLDMCNDAVDAKGWISVDGEATEEDLL